MLITDSAAEAARGSDVLATDTWISMGQENDGLDRESIFAPYRLSTQRLHEAAAGAVVLHCLPAYRGKEIDADGDRRTAVGGLGRGREPAGTSRRRS